jgi:hypothetical protein
MESQKYNFNDERWESFRPEGSEEAVERRNPKYYAAGSLEPSRRATRPASISSVKAHGLLA